MLWILILVGTIMAVFTGINLLIECFQERDGEIIRALAILTVIFIVVSIVSAKGVKAIENQVYTEVEQTDRLELVSLSDDNQFSKKVTRGGMYYIVAIDTESVYSFYYKVNENNDYKRRTLDADDTIICERENCTPCVVEYTTYTKNRLNGVLRAILTFGTARESEQKSYEIYVPTGTILRTYALDTQ